MEGMDRGTYRSWGSKVRNRRKLIGLSQEQLSQLTTLGQGTVSRIENGTFALSDNLKWRIAGALRCTLDDLFPWPPIAPPVPDVDLSLRVPAA